MPKYKKRDPEYTAIQFTGSNIREVMDELGPEFSTIYDLDIRGATDFVLEGYHKTHKIHTGEWIVTDLEKGGWIVLHPDDFDWQYTPVKRVGRPPKEKK